MVKGQRESDFRDTDPQSVLFKQVRVAASQLYPVLHLEASMADEERSGLIFRIADVAPGNRDVEEETDFLCWPGPSRRVGTHGETR